MPRMYGDEDLSGGWGSASQPTSGPVTPPAQPTVPVGVLKDPYDIARAMYTSEINPHAVTGYPLTAGEVDAWQKAGYISPEARYAAQVMKDSWLRAAKGAQAARDFGWGGGGGGGGGGGVFRTPNDWSPAPIVLPNLGGVGGGGTMEMNPFAFTPLNIDTTQPIRQFDLNDVNFLGLPTPARSQMSEFLPRWLRERGFNSGPEMGRFAPRTWSTYPGYRFNADVFNNIPDSSLREWAMKLFNFTPTTTGI